MNSAYFHTFYPFFLLSIVALSDEMFRSFVVFVSSEAGAGQRHKYYQSQDKLSTFEKCSLTGRQIQTFPKIKINIVVILFSLSFKQLQNKLKDHSIHQSPSLQT